MRSVHTTTRDDRGPRGGRRGFTLIEVLVVILIIALLAGLLIAGYQVAVRGARQAIGKQTVANLRTAVETFENENGFLPPLVFDGTARLAEVRPQLVGSSCAQFPVVTDDCDASNNTARASVYRIDQGFDRAFLSSTQFSGPRSYSPTRARANQRYSSLALAYYLTGALPVEIDGVTGAGYATPQIDGSFGSLDDRRFVFAPVSTRTREPLFDAGGTGATLRADYIDPIEYREHGLGDPPANPADQLFRAAIIDQNGRAYRYYRWLQPDGLSDLSRDEFFARAVGGAGAVPGYIPEILIDPELLSLVRQGRTEDDIRGLAPGLVDENLSPSVLGARFAIVGAGENGVFGTELIGDVLEAFGRSRNESLTAEAETRLRSEAWADNLVELGR